MPCALLIDDDRDMREILVELCEHIGWRCISADGVASARAALDGALPDVAVVDWSLPDGTGADVLAILEERAPSCAIVIATGYGRMVTHDLGPRLAGTLRKPYQLGELARLLNSHRP